MFAWRTRGRGKLYRLTIKSTSSTTVVKDFPYTLREPSTASSLLHHTKKSIFLKNYLLFGSLFSVMKHNSSVLFHLKLYMLWTKRPDQSANFQTSNCSHNFLKSFFNPPANFSLNIVSPFSVMTHDSSVIF